MGKDTPDPPDPYATAQAQTQSNLATAESNAELNRINQNTPYGSINYQTNGTNPDGTPKYTQNVTLSPAEQGLFNTNTQNQQSLANAAQGMIGQINNAYGTPIDTSGGPGIASTVQQNGATTAEAIKNAQDAAYKSQTQYLDPQFAQQGEALDNKLANMGVAYGSDAYNTAQNNQSLAKQQAYQSAQNAATTAGQSEQNTLYGQGLSSANLQNSANADYLNQLFQLRNAPINEYSALASGSQVQNPNFQNVPTANVAGTDVAGITQAGYQNQLSQSTQQNAWLNNLMQLGGTAVAAFA